MCIFIYIIYLFTSHYHGRLQLALYIYEYEAIQFPKTENNIRPKKFKSVVNYARNNSQLQDKFPNPNLVATFYIK